MHLAIRTLISSVYIREATRINHGVIQRGVEQYFILFGSFYLNARQCFIPLIVSTLRHSFKIPVCNVAL